MTVKKGQVHILLGENGAGKSTLIKILSGAYGREEGTVILDGNEMPPMPPGEVIKAGVSVIYQEFNLVPEMSVYENIFLGKEIVKVLRQLFRFRTGRFIQAIHTGNHFIQNLR